MQLAVLKKILETFGTPTAEQWPEFHRAGYTVQFGNTPAKDLIAVISRSNSSRAAVFNPACLDKVCPRLADDPDGLDLLSRLLCYDPCRRISARQAREHPWFLKC